MSELDPKSVVKHVIELLGGPEVAFEKVDGEFAQMMVLWDQDAPTIGRILRAHLFVEYFLTELLRTKNPQLGSLDNARLTFSQKVSLIDSKSSEIKYLLPGIRRLNQIRNRLAHSLHANLSVDDADALLSCDLFRAMRDESAKRHSRPASAEPLNVYEDFALHVGSTIKSLTSGSAAVWSEAYRLAQAEVSGSKSE